MIKHQETHPNLDEPDCFACRISGVQIGFTYGKRDWHDDTVAQRKRRIEERAAAKGQEIRPVTSVYTGR